MHPILVTKRPDRPQARVGMPFVHRAGGHRTAKARPIKSRTHERTLALRAQRAVGDVALCLHDELFGVGCLECGCRGLDHSEEADCKDSSLSRQAGETIFLRSLVSSTPHPVPDNTTVNRRQNVLSLFQLYAEDQMRAGVPPKGMEQAFAQTLQMSPSMWSQIKSSRPIGDKLARQIESLCGKPNGWLDEGHEPQGLSAGEQQFLAMALNAWRSTNAEGRKRLKLLMREFTGRG